MAPKQRCPTIEPLGGKTARITGKPQLISLTEEGGNVLVQDIVSNALSKLN